MEEENHDEFGLLTRRRFPFSSWSCRNAAFTPNPSLALVKFWQGRVELALRLVCLVSCLYSITSASRTRTYSLALPVS